MGPIPPTQGKQTPQAGLLSSANVPTLINQATTVYSTVLDLYDNGGTYFWITISKVMQVGSSFFVFIGVGMLIHGSPTNSFFPIVAAFAIYNLGKTWIIECRNEDAHSQLTNTLEKTGKCVDTLRDALNQQKEQSQVDREAHLSEKKALEELAIAQLAAQQAQADQQIKAMAAQLAAQESTNKDLKITVNTLAAAGGENLKQQLEATERLEKATLSVESKKAIDTVVINALNAPNLTKHEESVLKQILTVATNQKEAEKLIKEKYELSRNVLSTNLTKCGSGPDISENSHPNIATTKAS